MQTKFALRYEGPAVESGLMDVYEVSANMVAFSEFVIEAAKITYGPDVEARAEVAGFGRGSFVTDMVFNVAGVSATVFATVDAKTLWSIVKDSIAIWKHLKGSPPAKIEEHNNTVSITNNHGEVRQTNIQSLTVVFSEKASENAQRFIHEALNKRGMDAVELIAEGDKVERISQSESAYFVPVAPNEVVTDVTVRMSLVLESPVFKDGNKWRFFDGQQSFYATMEDKSFLARVDAGEAFRKGDIIVADVRISQQQAGLKLSAERFVVKVHEHKVRPIQMQLT